MLYLGPTSSPRPYVSPEENEPETYGRGDEVDI